MHWNISIKTPTTIVTWHIDSIHTAIIAATTAFSGISLKILLATITVASC